MTERDDRALEAQVATSSSLLADRNRKPIRIEILSDLRSEQILRLLGARYVVLEHAGVKFIEIAYAQPRTATARMVLMSCSA